MKFKSLIFIGVFLTSPVFAEVLDLDIALVKVHENCAGISTELNHIKTMAGINTAVTGVGTLVGGGAAAIGFVKKSKDKQVSNLEELLEELRQKEKDNPSDEPTEDELKAFNDEFDALFDSDKQTESELEKLNRQSKNLGNWRTGLMAGSAATNIAGAVIADGNKIKGDLKLQIDACRTSIKDLRDASMQARMDGKDITDAQNIIDKCKDWDTFDASVIDNRASGAKWSSVAGATTGVAGTITSAIANTDKTRDDNTELGKSKERKLNTASNVLAIGTTVASGTATVFNATQISAIKKASEIAENCEEALQ